MIRRAIKGILAGTILALFLSIPQALAQNGPKTFAFVNKQYVITAEVASAHTFIVNFINLSDFVIVIQPNEFIYKGASGRFYIGQVYEMKHKDARGEDQRYRASYLLKGHSFVGLTIVGSFHELDQIEELSIRIGAKRFYLQPLEKMNFEQLAAKINNLDLENPSATAALQDANIQERGIVKNTDGTSEWDHDWQGLIARDGVNPPKIIERPEIPITEEAKKKGTYGKVKLSGIISKNGEILYLKVVKGLKNGLNERALEGVQNSWVFLPATKNGEVVETELPSIVVEFPPPEEK